MAEMEAQINELTIATNEIRRATTVPFPNPNPNTLTFIFLCRRHRLYSKFRESIFSNNSS